MRGRTYTLLLAAALGLGACADAGPKQTAGTVIGGVGGALLGSQIGEGDTALIGAAAGALLGAWLGGEIGASLDEADRARAVQTAGVALDRNPDGQPASWSNPDTGNSGSTTPIRSYQTNGTYCRDYQTTIVSGGQTRSGTGTACRQPDGTWKIVR
jgi:surface antigen